MCGLYVDTCVCVLTRVWSMLVRMCGLCVDTCVCVLIRICAACLRGCYYPMVCLDEESFTQTPSTGLRHPSFGGGCRKAMLGV